MIRGSRSIPQTRPANPLKFIWRIIPAPAPRSSIESPGVKILRMRSRNIESSQFLSNSGYSHLSIFATRLLISPLPASCFAVTNPWRPKPAIEPPEDSLTYLQCLGHSTGEGDGDRTAIGHDQSDIGQLFSEFREIPTLLDCHLCIRCRRDY